MGAGSNRRAGRHGARSSIGRAPDCGSGGRGFEPHRAPPGRCSYTMPRMLTRSVFGASGHCAKGAEPMAHSSGAGEIHPGISVDPQIVHGKPVFTGTRILVATVLGALSAGDSMETDFDACGLTFRTGAGRDWIRGEFELA